MWGTQCISQFTVESSVQLIVTTQEIYPIMQCTCNNMLESRVVSVRPCYLCDNNDTYITATELVGSREKSE